MDNNKASALIEKYIAGTCTPEEKEMVERALDYISENSPEQFSEETLQYHAQLNWNAVKSNTISRKKPLRKLMPYVAAATLVLSLAIGYLFSEREHQDLRPDTVKAVQDVAPGGNYAVLTLPNGQKINLSQVKVGNIPNSFYTIKKSNDGEVVYTSSNSSLATPGEMNTIATPKGGQYVVQLADGSRVWLNAATEIKFPADFKGLKNRTIELTGEAYFEIAKKANQPFIVKTVTQEVQVLGTHFNINAYTDEPSVKTTLLEGSVKIKPLSTKLKSEKILKPGQEAILHQNNELTVQQGDINAASWKDGMIKIRNAELQAIMRQVSRWYNIDVVYKGSGKYERFTGTIPMNTNLSDLLKVLETKDLHFTIAVNPERKLIIETKHSDN